MKTTVLPVLLAFAIISARADTSFQSFVNGFDCDEPTLKKTLVESFVGEIPKSHDGQEISTIGTIQIIRFSCLVYPRHSAGDVRRMVRVDLDIAKNNFDKDGKPVQSPLANTSEMKLISYQVSIPSSSGIVLDPNTGAPRRAEAASTAKR